MTPVGAKQADDAVTRDIAGQRIRTVSVAYKFRANADLTYICLGLAGQVLAVSPAPNAPQNSYRNAASAHSTFSCTTRVRAERVEEGWNVRPVDGDMVAYLFKR